MQKCHLKCVRNFDVCFSFTVAWPYIMHNSLRDKTADVRQLIVQKCHGLNLGSVRVPFLIEVYDKFKKKKKKLTNSIINAQLLLLSNFTSRDIV